MKNLSRYMLLVVFLALLIPSSFSQTQIRPLCDGSPGTCFQDLSDVGGALQFGSFDPDGDFIAMQIPGSLDDHLQFRADGRAFVHIQDTEALFFFCPATAPSCPLDGEGSLLGSGRVQINSHLDLTIMPPVPLCPTTISASGTVFNDSGDAFDLTYVLVFVGNNTGNCRAVIDDITVSAVAP